MAPGILPSRPSDEPSEHGRPHDESARNMHAVEETRLTGNDVAIQDLFATLPELYEENILVKVMRTAERLLVPSGNGTSRTPAGYPEIVPSDGPNAGRYETREPEFWTCGFFPGTLHALLERAVKHPQAIRSQTVDASRLRRHLGPLCDAWSEPLHGMSSRTDTHDLGFMMMPALQRDWELNGNEHSLDSILRAARSLASRYVPTAGVIRSWDALLKKDIEVTDTAENTIVIIDSMCNLDLLFYASAHSGDAGLAKMAEQHARTLLRTHLRPETTPATSSFARVTQYRGQLYSSHHVANVDPASGEVKWRRTAQGFSDSSTWSRGQAWAILGYAQTYNWTKDRAFLDAACGAAEYFLYRLHTAPDCVEVPHPARSSSNASVPSTVGRYVPLWDFDAPVGEQGLVRDTSAGVIAANGMLILSQSLAAVGQYGLGAHFRTHAVRIVRDVLDLSLARELASLADVDGRIAVDDAATPGGMYEAVLKNGTANNNEFARRRCADHGLVYGDYYLVEFGNRLLGLGLV
ncbi:hypothetical protein N3K66_007798 [Trichothecium roseum]|uniref:Uncharacterized protein n=1 Tax=Trichothecium roseum TaxID=47278 RepID=A0ACC0USZ2_9HYPO|nr:hypothetical protein N3K66_007798 [Trichothecium roseum]